MPFELQERLIEPRVTWEMYTVSAVRTGVKGIHGTVKRVCSDYSIGSVSRMVNPAPRKAKSPNECVCHCKQESTAFLYHREEGGVA